MSKTKIIDLPNFTSGLRLLEDSASAPLGSAREIQNCLISDRGGISKRPGTLLLGAFNPSVKPTVGFAVYKKAFGDLHIPIKAYDTYTEYYHETFGWTRLESGFTEGSSWGFKEHLRNLDNQDYCYMCNRTEEYRRWLGNYTQLNGALVGGETTVTVDGTLESGVFLAETATSNAATTVTVSGAAWATDQWKNFYVLIKAGAHENAVRLIASNTADTITFATLGSGPGNVAFEVRQLAFPASGTLIINSEEVAYSAVPTQYTFTTSAIAGAHADNSPVTVKPTVYTGAPRGNRLEVNLDRMLVGNVLSGVSRDSSGNIQGSAGNLSVYVSKLRNATDFTFTATRVAGEGDIISFPEGASEVQDIINSEENFYVFTNGSITAIQYSQDENDVAIKTPLKTGVGSIGRAINGKNDVYFVTPDNVISSIGRIVQKDIKPEVESVGLVIKRLVDNFDFSDHSGIRYKQRIFHTCKSDSDTPYNDRTLVYNEQTKSYEGLWTLGAKGFDTYNNELYYANSRNPNVYKMFTGTADQDGNTLYPISSVWKSNWMNLTPSKANTQSIYGMYVEGFIWGGTEEIEFSVYSSYNTNSSFDFTFGIGNTDFLDDSTPLNGYFGGLPIGITPIGTLGTIQSDGSRHFSFIIYFPFIYSNFFSIGVANSESTAKFDITRMGLAVTEEPEFAATSVLPI